MHFLRVLYYQSYLFYKKGWTSITKYDDISLTTFLSISSMCALPWSTIGVLATSRFVFYNNHSELSIIVGVVIFMLIQFVLHYLLYRKGKWKQIVLDKPLLFNNRRLSAWITIAFFIITIIVTWVIVLVGRTFYQTY